jgi:hypothetical protein
MWSPRSMTRLRICWVVHRPSEFVVVPSRYTERLGTSSGARQEKFRNSLPEWGITVTKISNPEGLETALYQALVKPDRVGRDIAEWRGPVFAVPPLRGDEVARPGLMEALVAAGPRPGASAVGMTTALWGAGGFGNTTLRLRHTY